MTRSTVYQLRLHPDEKKLLADRADAEGVSIARYIREATGLTPRKGIDLADPTLLSKKVKQLEAQGHAPADALHRARNQLGL